ncbi:hypothetical protein SynTAK9802_01824 [Synechococcus sp. TAK9802]|nr:hypothetical protein SynTAK9802_01824 [Synechococcus sp. TAK9802]
MQQKQRRPRLSKKSEGRKSANSRAELAGLMNSGLVLNKRNTAIQQT